MKDIDNKDTKINQNNLDKFQTDLNNIPNNKKIIGVKGVVKLTKDL